MFVEESATDETSSPSDASKDSEFPIVLVLSNVRNSTGPLLNAGLQVRVVN